ncbi:MULTISPECIES: ATP-binding protein [Brevibacterium]|uniref:ATP-binding protein n=1 Tax=Brevibacterium casei TaxID=33889 RepID=A0A7T3ZYH7_9MICO|nr:ATP-binding protein [Brevibacterium casei]QQB13921.1 ATP-binding protein [Brevibacterium casei]
MTKVSTPFEFTVDLAVVESLGINLYSNAAAVLSELVANAWDADSNAVDIHWNESGDEITIIDDGNGMSQGELNSRFLRVAYKKREEEGTKSPVHKRPYMGRKGIGKLSVFSLAGEVDVFSAKDGQKNGFRINLESLRAHIARGESYRPEELESIPASLKDKGTVLILRKLNRKRTGVSVTALRRRLARRFDTLNYDEDDPKRFVIKVDGDPVTYEDREDLKRLEYLWQLGDSELDDSRTPNAKRRWVLEKNVIDAKRGWKIEGWFGTVSTPEELNDSDDEQESLRNIIILARKRPIQEGILEQLKFNKIFGNYVTGQIRAEFLDLDDDSDDIATSDRQRLIEDDDRAKALVKRLRELFNTAAAQWSDERPKQKFIELTNNYPAVRDWVNQRPEEQRNSAEKVIKTVASLHLENENQRPELFKASILAFERIALDATTRDLTKFADGLTATEVLPMLATAKSYEDALYVQILRSRLEAIEKLQALIDEDELEKVLQEHLFNNMWLLDPSWEGATGDVDMEKSLARIRSGSKVLFSKEEAENQEQGRIDIQYRSASGVHMIVELKKYRRRVSIDELKEQGGKYFEALNQVLSKQNEAVREIAVVFVIGEMPTTNYLGRSTLEEALASQLNHINGRVLYYDELLSTAQRRYKLYRDRRSEASKLDVVLEALDQRFDSSEEDGSVSGGAG